MSNEVGVDGKIDEMDASRFLIFFQDHVAPSLDVYEAAIYIFLVRSSRLIGRKEVVIGFKSARKKLAFGIGKAGTPPSEAIVYEKARRLAQKGLIEILSTDRLGTRLMVNLPWEVESFAKREISPAINSLEMEELDFFHTEVLRKSIIAREDCMCFYCRRELTTENVVMEHVISRPSGDNSYRNIVAACRSCNNKKGAVSAQEYVRLLYRSGFLSELEMREVLKRLACLQNGHLIPVIEKA